MSARTSKQRDGAPRHRSSAPACLLRRLCCIACARMREALNITSTWRVQPESPLWVAAQCRNFDRWSCTLRAPLLASAQQRESDAAPICSGACSAELRPRRPGRRRGTMTLCADAATCVCRLALQRGDVAPPSGGVCAPRHHEHECRRSRTAAFFEHAANHLASVRLAS